MKFKCIASGNVVEFFHPVDIESTLQNPAYVVVEEVEVDKVKTEKKTKNAAKEM